MSAVIVEGELVHYEVLGRGRPVILVHGWLGSWRYWVPAMSQLSMKYRTYALDLWGFGDSGKDVRHYDFASQVALLDQFMARLGISKAALIGHDFGAAIVSRFATIWPERVPRLMAVSPPMFRLAPGTPLIASPAPQPAPPVIAPPPASPAETLVASPFRSPRLSSAETIPARTDEMKSRLKAAVEAKERVDGDGKQPATTPPAEAAPAPPPVISLVPAPPAITPPAALAGGSADGDVQLPNPLRDHLDVLDPSALLDKHVEAGSDLEKLKAEVIKADKMAVARSVTSFAGVDTLRDLARLTVPALAVYGLNDTFLPPPDSEMIARLKDGRTNFHLIGMESTRHFPMLENIDTFSRLLLDFLELPDVTQVAIKKKWERRVR